MLLLPHTYSRTTTTTNAPHLINQTVQTVLQHSQSDLVTPALHTKFQTSSNPNATRNAPPHSGALLLSPAAAPRGTPAVGQGRRSTRRGAQHDARAQRRNRPRADAAARQGACGPHQLSAHDHTAAGGRAVGGGALCVPRRHVGGGGRRGQGHKVRTVLRRAVSWVVVVLGAAMSSTLSPPTHANTQGGGWQHINGRGQAEECGTL